MFQTAKDCSVIYKPNTIPPNINKFILILRDHVRQLYGNSVIDVDDMFNIAVCNFYTDHSHQISAHRDDERWLVPNQLDSDGTPLASIIASLTIYPDDPEPPHLRSFEIQNDENNRWESYDLHHNSVLFFSNHNHRAKALSKKKENVCRYNLTFRTVVGGLLGNVGYSNFYRYMSIPMRIIMTDKDSNKDKEQYYIEAAKEANIFNRRDVFDTHIPVDIITRTDYDIVRISNKHKFDILPRYVKSLCSNSLVID